MVIIPGIPFFSNMFRMISTAIHIGTFLTLFSLVTANYENERIITDLEVIYGSHGVPIEYWYNETTAVNDTQLGSVPNCPKSIDGFPWVYYGQPPRCFLSGHYGPCPIGEKLMLQRGSLHGVCACECLVENTVEIVQPLILPEDERYLYCKSGRIDAPVYGQVYDRNEGKCYSMFEQGPCSQGNVIVSWTSESLECFSLCDEKTEEWCKQRDEGLCRQKPFVPVYGTPSVFRNGECPENQRYSDLLKKCVSKVVGQGTILLDK